MALYFQNGLTAKVCIVEATFVVAFWVVFTQRVATWATPTRIFYSAINPLNCAN